jgi:hypothetical protein
VCHSQEEDARKTAWRKQTYQANGILTLNYDLSLCIYIYIYIYISLSVYLLFPTSLPVTLICHDPFKRPS